MFQQRLASTRSVNNNNLRQGTNDIRNEPGYNAATSACEQCRSRKVRCDRQLRQCSNCEKAGVMCEFPNRGKRINHVKQLVENVTGLAARLDTLDGTISNLAQHVTLLTTKGIRTSHSSSRESASDLSFSNFEDVETIFSQPSTADRCTLHDVSQTSLAIQEVDQTANTINARSLFDAVWRMLGYQLNKIESHCAGPPQSDSGSYSQIACLETTSFHIKSELIHKYESYPFRNYKEEIVFPTSDKPVAAPPLFLLDACFSPYLELFNVSTPVFDEDCLREAIHACYMQDANDIDEAYRLCFNNIIVLASGLRSRAARLSNDSPKGMDDDLLPAFLNNSFRAFRHLENFLQPKLINVQALITLAMVVREYHESKYFEMICQMTVHVMKLIESQRLTMSINYLCSKEFKQAQNIYWTLFVMDKTRAFATGVSFDLHLYDSDVEFLQTLSTQDVAHQLRTAHIYLMAIWEEIYISLYSTRAIRRGRIYRQHQIERLDSLSRNWCSRNAHIFSDSSSDQTSNIGILRTELKYTFHVTQILIHRCSTDTSSSDVEITNSRAALQIVNTIQRSASNVHCIALLSRLIRNYPLVAVHSLYTRFLENPNQDTLNDVSLVNELRDALASICNPNVESCCLNRVFAGVEWYVEIAHLIRQAIIASPSRSSSAARFSPSTMTKRNQDSLSRLNENQEQDETQQASEPPSKKSRQSLDDSKDQPPSVLDSHDNNNKNNNNNSPSSSSSWLPQDRAAVLTTSSESTLSNMSVLQENSNADLSISDMDMTEFLQELLPLAMNKQQLSTHYCIDPAVQSISSPESTHPSSFIITPSLITSRNDMKQANEFQYNTFPFADCSMGASDTEHTDLPLSERFFLNFP